MEKCLNTNVDGHCFLLEELAVICPQLKLNPNASQLGKLAYYAEMVIKWNKIVNLTSARTSADFLNQHIVDGLAIVPHLVGEINIIDVGSGCGVPGVALGIMCPDSKVTLLEPRERRTRFLEQVRIELDLSNVVVVGGKVEDVCSNFSALRPTLITRAFGTMSKFVKLVLPLIETGSKVCFMKSEVNEEDLKNAEAVLGGNYVISLEVPGYRRRSLIIFNNSSDD